MRSGRIVEVDEARQSVQSVLVGVVGPTVCPLSKQCLDDPFGFAVGLRPAGSSALVSGAQILDEGAISAASRVGESVVGHDTLDPDAKMSEPRGCDLESMGSGSSGIVGHRDHDGVSAGVVDHHLKVVISGFAPAAVSSVAPAVRPPSAAVGYSPELLVVLMDESSWMAGNVTNRRSRYPIGMIQAVEAASDQDAVDS